MTFCYLLQTSFCYSQLYIFINKVCHQEAVNWWWPVIATVKDTTRPTSAQSWVEVLLSGKELHLTACWQTMILSYSTLLTPHLKGSAIMEQWLDVLSTLITTYLCHNSLSELVQNWLGWTSAVFMTVMKPPLLAPQSSQQVHINKRWICHLVSH